MLEDSTGIRLATTTLGGLMPDTDTLSESECFVSATLELTESELCALDAQE